MIIPVVCSKKDLEYMVEKSGIDIDVNINDCRRYIALKGWTVHKKKRIKREDRTIFENGIVKKVLGINGFEYQIRRDELIVGAIMENERDALLLCILTAIRRKY